MPYPCTLSLSGYCCKSGPASTFLLSPLQARSPVPHYFPSSEHHFLTASWVPGTAYARFCKLSRTNHIHLFRNCIWLCWGHPCSPATQLGHRQVTCAAFPFSLPTPGAQGTVYLGPLLVFKTPLRILRWKSVGVLVRRGCRFYRDGDEI